MISRTKPLLAIACLLTLMTTACDSSSASRDTREHDSREQAASPSPRPRSSADLSVPLQPYELTSRQYAQVQRARMKAIHQCMSRFGISLETPVIREVRWSHVPARVGWLGDRKPSWYGYRGPVGYQSDQYAAATRGGTKALLVPERYHGVYGGSVGVFNGRPVPSGGCQGEARRRLDGPGGTLRRSLRDEPIIPWKSLAGIESSAAGKVARDRRYQAVQGRWRDCMNRSGYSYASPVDAENDPRWARTVSMTDEEPEQPVSQTEIQTAVADDKCRDEVNLPGISLALHVSYQREEIRAHATKLTQIRKLLQIQLRNSSAIHNTETRSS
jgi:hypothetical protein